MYDLCVIGGGVNGAGIVRDAAGRGMKVLLLEARDLASGTSSKSTKLVHGGLRYLEYYEFGLVRDALKEREVLLSIAPDIIRPMEFILPHSPDLRPKWMIKTGLFFYDRLAERKKIPASKAVSVRRMGLEHSYKEGFSYWDCWVEDARLVSLNAMDARARGADVFTYMEVTHCEDCKNSWIIDTKDHFSGETKQFRAKALVNAGGPWVDDVLKRAGLTHTRTPPVRLVKGSHIIVPRRLEGEHSFLLQQKDGRIVFAIPYEDAFTLIGTTEEAYEGDPYSADISADEKKYLVDAYNASFEKNISTSDIVHTYSGVRALFDDGSKDAKSVTRDYRLHVHKQTRNPMLSVFGGKITTYRVLAEKALNMLFDEKVSWTGKEALPRYAGYKDADIDFEYYIENEFVRTIEDVLWRRTKRGLHMSAEEIQQAKEKFDAIIG